MTEMNGRPGCFSAGCVSAGEEEDPPGKQPSAPRTLRCRRRFDLMGPSSRRIAAVQTVGRLCR